jgi:superfamily I DNA and RNA helicase
MIEKVVASARLKSDPIARQLIDFVVGNAQALGLGNAVLYYDFPLFRDYEESLFQPTLLLLDPNKGVVSVRVAGTQFEVAHEDDRLSELHSILFAKLLTSRRLRKTRSELKVGITSVLFLPPGTDPAAVQTENAAVSSTEGLSKELGAIHAAPMAPEEFQEARSVIEGVKALTKPVARDVPTDGSKPKAVVLKKLEEEIANFDANQRMAALTVPIGPQRIRGLAGSGKTIVLAWKAAHLHMQEPDKKILFTFYTRSLYDIIRKQITRFYRHFKDSDPNWENLNVLHAWGGRRTAGVYYDTCIEHDVAPKQWGEVMSKPVPFQFVCEDLMKRVDVQSKYDMVLVDEAQDFPEAFFQLLFKLTKGDRDSKRIIWAYDELQSIFEPRMRSASELFGIDVDGQARVDLDRAKAFHGLADYVDNDLILKKCYRNPLDVLVCSHALGLGIYGPEIVQMLQNREHWEDLGYEVEQGDFTVGAKTVIVRPTKNSPLAINAYEKREEIVQWFEAPTFKDELDWIVQEAQQLLADGLSPEEILVICLDDRNVKSYFQSLANRFSQNGLPTNDLLSNPFSTPQFIIDGHITLSTVHRAKGNEAPAVLVCGADAVAYDLNRRRSRNKLFTAFTRTKGWLRISGLPGAKPIFNELKTALENSPRLVFDWPDLGKVNTLQRDLSKKEEKIRKAREEYIKKLATLGVTEEEALQELQGEEKTE